MRLWYSSAISAAVVLLLAGAAVAWDSSSRNPTHPTHSCFTEYAIAQLKGSYPEVDEFRKQLIDGSNAEIHELNIKCTRYGVDFNQKRTGRYAGTNPGCKHPDLMWTDARSAYGQGNKELAYFTVGMLLHQIEDMGVPAHAHNVYHQGNLKEFDYFEYVALWNWKPDFALVDKQDPALKDRAHYTDPSAYYEFSRKWCVVDFPTYKSRKSFSKTWTFASRSERRPLSKRQAATATVTKWALAAAMVSFSKLRTSDSKGPD